MTQAQQERITAASNAFSAASAAKVQAEAEDRIAGAEMDKAKEFARVGVLAEMQKLQDQANIDAAAAVTKFTIAFQKACDATNAYGAALAELNAAIADSANAPGTVEKVA